MINVYAIQDSRIMTPVHDLKLQCIKGAQLELFLPVNRDNNWNFEGSSCLTRREMQVYSALRLK